MKFLQTLEFHIKDHEAIGSIDMSKSLGIQKMPENYALMLNPDGTHFYWLNNYGIESSIHWNKWAIYRWAKNHSISSQSVGNTSKEGGNRPCQNS